jgi:hypothetical protein
LAASAVTLVPAAAVVEASRNHTPTEDRAAITANAKRQGPTASLVVARGRPPNPGSKVSDSVNTS